MSTPPAPIPSAVIDTQVVMDWLVFRNPGVQALFDAVTSGAVRWLASPPMRDEILHVLSRSVAARYAPDAAFVATRFDAHAELMAGAEPSPRLVCRDPDDQKFIDLALAARATWLISRDKALLALAKRAAPRGLLILPPSRWIQP